MTDEYTTIQITKSIKERLDKLKIHPREPYNDVIKRLFIKIDNKKVT